MTSSTQPKASNKKRFFLTRLFLRNSSHGKSKGVNGAEVSSPMTEKPGGSPSTTPPSAPSHNQKAEANGHDAGDLLDSSKESSPPEQPELIDKGKEKGGNETDSAVQTETENVDESGGGGGVSNDEEEADGNDSTANSIDSDDEEGNDGGKSKPGHRRSLWAAALNSDEVGEKRRACLMAEWKDMEAADSATDSKQLVNNVIDLTQDKLKVYTKRWGDKDDKKTTPGTARSILLSALTFKDLVDSVLKFDPTGYGSSAWAVVSFGLTLVQNDKERMDRTFEACSYLADLMARYSRMETHYWNRRVKQGKPLEDAIIKVYTAILVYSAKVKESTESEGFNRLAKSFISLTEKPLEDLKSAIDRENATVGEWQQQVDRERHDEDSEKLKDIEKKTDDILDRVIGAAETIAEVLDKTKEEELRELYKWLLSIERPAGQDKTHEDLANKIQNGEESDKDTEGDEHYKIGGWFLTGETYRIWKQYPQSLLWLYGKSACGKSSLCSTIIQDLEDAFDADESKVLVYWYFCFDLEESTTIDLLIISLLRQLASEFKGFPDDNILKWFRTRQNKGRQPKKIERLFQYLCDFISKIDKDVFIVLDGLDQVPAHKGGIRVRPKLLELITNLTKAEYPNLHILLVSRDEQDIRSCLTKLGDILVPEDIEKGLEGDLDHFIMKKLDKMELLKGNTSLKEEVKARLDLDSQDRNFLWATSVLEDVATCHDVKNIPGVLTKVPMSMVAVYETALKNVKKEDEERMKSILLWLLNQLRPLSQNELAAAVGLPNPSLVTEICTRALVESSKQPTTVAGKDRQLDVFRFAHFSVREYLESVISGPLENLAAKPEVARFNLSEQDAHFEMTKRCLDVLSACCLHRGDRDIEATDSDSGTSDANSDASTADSDSEVEDDDADSGEGSGYPEEPLLKYAAEYWFRHYKMINRDRVGGDGLEKLDDEIWSHLLFDKQKLEFWLKTYDPDHRPPIGGVDETPSPVYYAVKLELVGIPERLVGDTLLPPVLNGDSPNDMMNRLELDQVVEYRLDKPGAEGTALQLAAHQRQIAVLDALIQRRADVNARRGLHGTALYASAAIGDENGVRRLLKAKAKANGTEDGELGSPLHAAAYAGHETVVQVLLNEGGVPVDHEAGPFGTALQAASALRKHTTIKLLLDMNADPNIVSGCFGTAAQAASTNLGLGRPKRSDRVVNTLWNSGAKFLWNFNFWGTAYDRATAQDSGSEHRNKAGYRDSRSYTRLVQGSGSEVRDLKALSESQQLFACIKAQWRLPAKGELSRICDDFRDLLCRIPFEDQLDAILRLVPKQEVSVQALQNSDFAYQALFWAGVNQILIMLRYLVAECMDQVQTELREGQDYDPRYDPRLGAAVSPSYAFRWAFEEFRAGYSRPSRARDYRRRVNVFLRRKMENRLWEIDNEDLDSAGYVARSDLVAITLMKQRQALKRLEELEYQEMLLGKPSDSSTRIPPAAKSIVWVTSDVLDLVRHLLEYGNNCIQYQHAVSTLQEIPLEQQQAIEDLTSELFLAVIRLALGSSERIDVANLAQTVQLLTTVRLERIRQLDAICQKKVFPPELQRVGFQLASTDNHNHDLPVQEIATEVTRQVEGIIKNWVATDMVSQIQRQVSGVVTENVSRLVEQIERELQQKIRDEVQRQLETPSVSGQTHRGWLSKFPGMG
ncbi:hypothetical protein HD806DRAFT_511251 [Xylariaceae sp. AK1471]|nr:hypothetical protein HD806DRAFT_511251 [Xylariaceae sp. AK1471]